MQGRLARSKRRATGWCLRPSQRRACLVSKALTTTSNPITDPQGICSEILRDVGARKLAQRLAGR